MSTGRSRRSALAAAIALAVVLSGCAAIGGRAISLPAAPALDVGCTPASAAISTGPVTADGSIVVLAERAGFSAGAQTSPTVSSEGGITVKLDPGAVFDPFAVDRAGWTRAIVTAASAHHLVPAGFGDDATLTSLRRTTAYPTLSIGSGVYVIATIADAGSLRFTIRCGRTLIAGGTVVSPSTDGSVSTVLVDCGDPATDAVSRLVRPSCGADGASAKDPEG